jgi:hypothetical protein
MGDKSALLIGMFRTLAFCLISIDAFAGRPAQVDTDKSHYPIQFEILDVKWQPTSTEFHTGVGHGNFRSGSEHLAVNFTVSCPREFAGSSYHAKWVRERSDLSVVILKKKLKDSYTCEVTTVPQTGV